METVVKWAVDKSLGSKTFLKMKMPQTIPVTPCYLLAEG